MFCSLLYPQHLEMCPKQNAEWMNGQARASWPISYSITRSCIFHSHHRFFKGLPLTHSWCQMIPTSIPETWKASQTIKPHTCPHPLFKCGCGSNSVDLTAAHIGRLISIAILVTLVQATKDLLQWLTNLQPTRTLPRTERVKFLKLQVRAPKLPA